MHCAVVILIWKSEMGQPVSHYAVFAFLLGTEKSEGQQMYIVYAFDQIQLKYTCERKSVYYMYLIGFSKRAF